MDSYMQALFYMCAMRHMYEIFVLDALLLFFYAKV